VSRMLNATYRVLNKFHRDNCPCSITCSQSLFITEFINEQLQNSMGDIRVTIRIRDNRILNIEEIPATSFSSLVANIGSIIGLLTGFCILDILEVIQPLYSKILLAFHHRLHFQNKNKIIFLNRLNETSSISAGRSATINGNSILRSKIKTSISRC